MFVSRELPVSQSNNHEMVMVATERGGRARATKAETQSERTLMQFIPRNLDIHGIGGRIVLCTDALPAYRWIGSKFSAHLWATTRPASMFAATGIMLRMPIR